MKTIFLPIFQGVEARNLLRNDFFKKLCGHQDVRIIILVPSEEKADYLKREFNFSNLFYEVVTGYKIPTWNNLFTFLKFNLLNTRRMDIRRRVSLAEDGNYLSFLFKLVLNRLFANPLCRRFVRWLDFNLVEDSNFVSIFNKYSPDLLIAAHLFGDQETSLLRQAKKRGIISVGVINSWDKLTSRGILRLLPTKLVVHNEIIKNEAIKHGDMDPEDIFVIGAPHYDLFFRGTPRSRQFLDNKLGLRPETPIILICPTGQYYSDSDVSLINGLIKLKKSKIISPVQLVVRFPPNDIVNLDNISDPNEIISHQPGVRFSSKRGIDWDMDDEDNQLLIDTLFWSSVVICPPSSISIDAAILNKPIINFRITGDNRWSNKNINLFYSADHYIKLLDTGGVSVVDGFEELADTVNLYLKHPEINESGRKSIVKSQCQYEDGRSGERLYGLVVRWLNIPSQ